MIEHLRKYTGMIIFVIALLFVGLAFFGDRSSIGSASAGNPVVLTVDGTGYTAKNFRKLAEAPLVLTQNQEFFSSSMQLGLFSFVAELGAFGADADQGPRRFFINRLNIREAAKEFGVYPSDDEVEARVKKGFTTRPTPDGKGGGQFDQEGYNDLVQGLQRFGMQEADLIELVRDILTSEKLKEIIGGGLAGSRQQVVESVANQHQQVSVQVARTALGTFQEQIKPTDEELKAAWETTKEKYMVERKIKVSYLLAKPQYPEKKTEPPKLPTAVNEEQKKAEEQAEQDKKAAEEAEYAKAKSAIDDQVLNKVETVLAGIQNSAGKDFEKVVGEQGWQLVATDLFQRSAMPPELSMSTAESTPKPVSDYLFRLVASNDESLSNFTEALQLKDNAYLIARLDGSEDARPKTFDEAKEEVRADYLKEKASEALKKDADDKAAKIREGLKAGKPFAEVAKEVGLEPKSHGPFKASDKVEGEADVSTLFQTASTVDPGSLADPVIKPDGAIFVFVEKRELVKDPAREDSINQSVKAMTDGMQRSAFESWLNERLNTTRVEDPMSKVKR
jgi:hypothetical protein